MYEILAGLGFLVAVGVVIYLLDLLCNTEIGAFVVILGILLGVAYGIGSLVLLI